MKIELCISRDRIPYIVGEFGADRVVVSKYNEDQDLVTFEVDSQMDFLYMFHAGVRCGSENMAKALTKQVA
jgi:hypothetical protein